MGGRTQSQVSLQESSVPGPEPSGSGEERLLILEVTRLLFHVEHELARFRGRADAGNAEAIQNLAANVVRQCDQFRDAQFTGDLGYEAHKRKAKRQELLEQLGHRIRERGSPSYRMLYNGATQGDTALGQLLNRAKDVVTESLEELLHACRNRLSESQRADAFEQAASVAVQELRSAW